MSFTERIKQVMTSITGTEKKAEEQLITDVHQIFLNTPEHIEQGIALADKTIIPDAVNAQHITFVGMGGSLHSAFLLKTYLENIGCKKQINLVRDYTIPGWVSKKGFLIVSSYSGNTAETLEAYRQAYREGYKLLVMTSGGKLKEYAEKNGTPIILLPKGYQPRYTVYHFFGALLQIFQNSGIIEKHEDIIAEAIKILHRPVFETMGKQIAEKINGKVPIIYTSPKLSGVNQRWKIYLNENTKIHAFYNELPELDHNELNGYLSKNENFHVIFLVDEEEAKWHRQRISATKQIIKEYGCPTTEIIIKGPSYLARMLSAISIGDWTSYYYAQQRGVDPKDIEVIEKLKRIIAK